MSISKIRSAAYLVGRILGDVQAVRRGTIAKRIAPKGSGQVHRTTPAKADPVTYKVTATLTLTYTISDDAYANSYRPFSDEETPQEVITDVDGVSLADDPGTLIAVADAVATSFSVREAETVDGPEGNGFHLR